MKIFFTVIFLSIVACMAPMSVLAWNVGDTDQLIIQELGSSSQPEGYSELSQGKMQAKYIRNDTRLTDRIIITLDGKNRTIRGPWSIANTSRRMQVRNCMRDTGLSASGCGFFDYKIIRLSPSGNYIELAGTSWEGAMWRLIDTRTGKIVLSNDNGVEKSLWSDDRKSIAFKTFDCEIGGCSDSRGYFMTMSGQFPKFRTLIAR